MMDCSAFLPAYATVQAAPRWLPSHTHVEFQAEVWHHARVLGRHGMVRTCWRYARRAQHTLCKISLHSQYLYLLPAAF